MSAVDCTSPSTVDAEHRCLMPRNTCPSLRSDTPIIRRSGRLAQIADTAAFTASTAETDWLDRLWSFRHDDEALAAGGLRTLLGERHLEALPLLLKLIFVQSLLK